MKYLFRPKFISSRYSKIAGDLSSQHLRRSSSSSSSGCVTVKTLKDGIVQVELNRPDKHNGLDMDMFQGIADAAKSLAGDRAVRCIILSGSGKSFCTGLDVKSVMSTPTNMAKLLEKPNGTPISNLAQDVGYLWRQVKCPVIASLHGMCFGGGLQIALGADFRISTPDCKISILEAKWGLIPDMSAAVTLRELVRIDIAKELTMTGRIISGEEAARIGLVTRCAADPFQASLALAEEIVARSPDSVADTKTLFQNTFANGCSEKEALEWETSLQRKLLGSYNQLMASSRNFGNNILPYKDRRSDK